MKVADICTREVVATGRGASLQQAAALMREPLRAARPVAARIPEYSF